MGVISSIWKYARDSKIKHDITTVSTATYETTGNDYTLHVTRTATGACQITVKTLHASQKKEFTIKDAAGNATAFNITVVGEGGETFDGQANIIISGDYDSITIYSDGTNWFIK